MLILTCGPCNSKGFLSVLEYHIKRYIYCIYYYYYYSSEHVFRCLALVVRLTEEEILSNVLRVAGLLQVYMINVYYKMCCY